MSISEIGSVYEERKIERVCMRERVHVVVCTYVREGVRV